MCLWVDVFLLSLFVSSLALEFVLELLCEAPVGLEGSITSLFLQFGIPVIELVEAVAEAETLLHGQVAHVLSFGALSVATIVQVNHGGVVLLNLCMEEVFSTQLGVLQSLRENKERSVIKC